MKLLLIINASNMQILNSKTEVKTWLLKVFTLINIIIQTRTKKRKIEVRVMGEVEG